MKWGHAILILVLLSLKAMACGLNWSEPVSHFENVDFQGNVHIVRKIGEIENLPLYLIFNSSYGVSPYLGSGFEIPFLESRIWQIDENRFVAKMPSGWLWLFQRTKDPSILDGSAGWKAQINGAIITAWAACGDKIIFKNGRITSMHLKGGRVYTYIYKDNRVESIEENGKNILRVEINEKNRELTRLILSENKEIEVKYSTRPLVQRIGNQNIISAVDATLGAITKADGTRSVFEFSVDGNVSPQLTFGENVFVWNASTHMIQKDSEWTYEINPNTDMFENAAIKRRNLKNQEEYWYLDKKTGVETTVFADGRETIATRFASGKMSGKIRRNQTTFSDGTVMEQRFRYNETGILISKLTSYPSPGQLFGDFKISSSNINYENNINLGQH